MSYYKLSNGDLKFDLLLPFTTFQGQSGQIAPHTVVIGIFGPNNTFDCSGEF